MRRLNKYLLTLMQKSSPEAKLSREYADWSDLVEEAEDMRKHMSKSLHSVNFIACTGEACARCREAIDHMSSVHGKAIKPSEVLEPLRHNGYKMYLCKCRKMDLSPKEFY